MQIQLRDIDSIVPYDGHLSKNTHSHKSPVVILQLCNIMTCVQTTDNTRTPKNPLTYFLSSEHR